MEADKGSGKSTGMKIYATVSLERARKQRDMAEKEYAVDKCEKNFLNLRVAQWIVDTIKKHDEKMKIAASSTESCTASYVNSVENKIYKRSNEENNV
jgi:hypothetical protein